MLRVVLALVFVGPALWAGQQLPVRGADELFWVPTLEQALEMAKSTGRPIFMMGYSLVDERSTYTKLGTEYCSSVF
jgi:hypothetical protein